MKLVQKIRPKLLLLATVGGMFGLGKWWPAGGSPEPLQREQVVPIAATAHVQPTDYESSVARLAVADFPAQWKALDSIPLADRDLTWPIKCGVLWEGWAKADLPGALAALPAAPELPVEPAKEFDFTLIGQAAKPAEPGWVPDLPRHAVFAAWARAESEAALARAKELPAAERVAALRGVMETLATTNPLRFLQEATTMGPLYTNFDRLQAFEHLANSSPAEAAAFIKQVPTGSFASWDPRHGSYQDDAWQIVLQTWAKRDLQAAASFTETLTGNDFPLRLWVFGALVDADPARAAGWLPDLTRNSRHDVQSLSFAQMATLVPHVQDQNLLRNLLRSAIQRFPYCSAEQFPDAKRLFDALPAVDQQDGDRWRELITLWRKADPAAAFQAILDRPDSRDKSELLQDFVYPSHYGEVEDAKEIQQRWDQVPAELRPGVAAKLIEVLASNEAPPALIRNILNQIPAGKERHTALISYYYGRSDRGRVNQRDLAAQLMQEPETNELTGAYYQVTKAWAEKQSLEASQWVKELPVGATRDHAISGLVVSLATAEPKAGLAWLAEIKDDATVAGTLRIATERMKPDQKRTFLQQSTHPAAQALLSKLPTTP